jgi:hypothetical protein
MSFDPIADDANSADPMQQVDGAHRASRTEKFQIWTEICSPGLQ